MFPEDEERDAGLGERGEHVPGPPWILGHRGSPREAPEKDAAAGRFVDSGRQR